MNFLSITVTVDIEAVRGDNKGLWFPRSLRAAEAVWVDVTVEVRAGPGFEGVGWGQFRDFITSSSL